MAQSAFEGERGRGGEGEGAVCSARGRKEAELNMGEKVLRQSERNGES